MLVGGIKWILEQNNNSDLVLSLDEGTSGRHAKFPAFCPNAALGNTVSKV
jgi:hypothetical protein